MLRQQVNKIYNTAIYCRLSKDDGTNTESTSIGTQKEILTKAPLLHSLIEKITISEAAVMDWDRKHQAGIV